MVGEALSSLAPVHANFNFPSLVGDMVGAVVIYLLRQRSWVAGTSPAGTREGGGVCVGGPQFLSPNTRRASPPRLHAAHDRPDPL